MVLKRKEYNYIIALKSEASPVLRLESSFSYWIFFWILLDVLLGNSLFSHNWIFSDGFSNCWRLSSNITQDPVMKGIAGLHDYLFYFQKCYKQQQTEQKDRENSRRRFFFDNLIVLTCWQAN